MHENPVILEQQTTVATEYLKNLGWQINQAKSSTIPSTTIEYLGITWNTSQNTKGLSIPKIQQLQKFIQDLWRKAQWSWYDAKLILGRLNFASFTVPLGRLHCRQLQKSARLLSQTRPHRKHYIPDAAPEQLKWWIENLHKRSPIHYPGPSIFVTTDAAEGGWGAIANGRHLWGKWTHCQRKWHSNLKELWAVHEVLQSLGAEIRHWTIMVPSDNRTTVAYINKHGGTRSARLLKATTQILELCDLMDCHLIARYIPGIYNGIADRLSREKALPE
ncbi:hypothetical protein O3G_MSEX011063 [Manduca sexta]|uniref:Uncharacterized protein n=1 Tax=Manduca sexta TaxID=7130 RepID=A0A922CUF6_MANSE|nr:hypothetical protein O3G_MSEX011063 [Manduca sexta]